MSKSEKRQRTVLFLGIRWFPEEKEQVCESARAAGLSAGEFVRRCTLGRRIVAKGDTRQMNEILKQGGLLKHLYSEMKKDGLMTTERSEEFSDALVAMQVAFLKFDASSLNNSGE
ncbi:plasmid mobilization protein MobA [Escherichia sp. E1130]|uniref:plasmid mobilization protein MobA n=1 Tax=Escherichia sp. E1130 TaxID=2041645 RepID=UPI0010819553|nr:plasmid mobilization protein MobA [Escherichia sp. E1130]TGC24410.1 mobilization protein [Escherichia sp. E1130]